MNKYLVNPKASNAFTSEVMHKVVLNGIDFELPEHIWDAIDDGFGYYWNVEVGYGGWPDLNSAVSSISNWMQKEHIVFAVDKIVTIVNIMFDWIEQIPGAILDDDAIVIPCSFEDDEKERQKVKNLVKEHEALQKEIMTSHKKNFAQGCLTPVNFKDAWTNIVYISDKLKDFFPDI